MTEFERSLRMFEKQFGLKLGLGMVLLTFGILWLNQRSHRDPKSLSAVFLHNAWVYAPFFLIVSGTIFLLAGILQRKKRKPTDEFIKVQTEDGDFDYNKSKVDQKDSLKNISAEVDFKITIINPELNFLKLREQLYGASREAAHRIYNIGIYDERRSPFESLIREKLKRITNEERFFLVVTNYAEGEGSFLISFSFLIFTSLMSYKDFSENMKAVRNDLNSFLTSVFPDDSNIIVTFNDKPNQLINNIDSSMSGQTFKTINAEFKKLKWLIILIGMVALGLSIYGVYKVETATAKPSIDDSAIQSMVKTEIDRVNMEKNLGEMIERLVKQQLAQPKTDTAIIKK